MRRWAPPVAAGTSREPDAIAPSGELGGALAGMVRGLGEPGFEAAVLHALQPLLPAASWSVYRTGPRCPPRLFMSSSLGISDTTRDCWGAYLSGPHLCDRSWLGLDRAARAVPAAQLCHVTAAEVGGEHRARVYDAHGMVERVSVVEREEDGNGLFAINFYRHEHQRAFADAQIASFAALAVALLELVRKQIALLPPAAARASLPVVLAPPGGPARHSAAALRERLSQIDARLTARELDVCVRLLQGMTQDGIACDLGLGLPTVKTYRNRAFERLGIHFRNELFALMLAR